MFYKEKPKEFDFYQGGDINCYGTWMSRWVEIAAPFSRSRCCFNKMEESNFDGDRVICLEMKIISKVR